MKKAYMKPEIMFESFASSTNIAGDCLVIIDTPAYGTCGYPVQSAGGALSWNIFTAEFPKACDTTDGARDGKDDGSYYNEVCYDVPVGSNLFNS